MQENFLGQEFRMALRLSGDQIMASEHRIGI